MSKTLKTRSISPGLVIGLALKDLRHEWILTLCLMLAIAAVIAPLLLLFGLKYGTIETLRFRLIEDPRNREIRPLASRTFDREWFDSMSQRPDVAFVTPMTRQISAQVEAWLPAAEGETSTPTSLDLIPSAHGDPLLIENGSPIPGPGECVLSQFAAESTGAKVGDTLILEVSRTRNARRQNQQVSVKVIGILDLRATALKSLYVPITFLEQVESYKDGQLVPELQWPGDTPHAYPLWDGVVVMTRNPLPDLQVRRLLANTGFTQSRKLPVEQQAGQLGYRFVSAPIEPLQLFTQTRPLGDASIVGVQNQLRGMEAQVLPWVRPMEGKLNSPMLNEPYPVTLRILPNEAQPESLLPEPPWAGSLKSGLDLMRILVPADWSGGHEEVILSFEWPGGNRIEFPVVPIPAEGLASHHILAQSRLGGVLNLAASRPLRFEAETGEFLLSRRGYAGFRLYGKSLESIEGLRRFFESDGLPVSTEAEKINTVLQMDRYLTLIFWLIAAVGIAGSIASLVASLYASVERKRKELSVLRLIGLTGFPLYRMPIYQGVVIAIGSFGIAWGAFSLIGETINRLFASHLRSGESFCHLPTNYLVGVLLCAVAVACLSALAACFKLARIDPAEALRDE